MPRYHGKEDILEEELDDLEARISKSEKKLRDFKDEIRDMVEREVDRIIGQKLEERIKKSLGKDLGILIGDIYDKLSKIEKETVEVKKVQENEHDWWQRNWNNDYLKVLQTLLYRRDQRASSRRLPASPDRGSYGFGHSGFGRLGFGSR